MPSQSSKPPPGQRLYTKISPAGEEKPQSPRRAHLHEIIFEAARRHGGQSKEACPGCGSEGHDHDTVYCKHCGMKL